MKKTDKKKIAVNTLSMYMKTLLRVGLVLFSSRWVLDALGVKDYGIFCTIGAMIGILMFVNSAMTYSVQRFLAFGIGQGVVEELKKIFNVGVLIHFCLAVFTLILGLMLGPWYIDNLLNIEDSSVTVARYVFYFVLVSTFTTIASIPYTALYVAHQRMLALTAFEIVPPVFIFVLAYFLRYIPENRLIVYAAGTVGVGILVQMAQVLWCQFIFPEAQLKFSLMKDKQLIKKMLSFSGWNLFGMLGSVFSRQGVVLLINYLFGTTVNAAYGLATQVNDQSGQFTIGFLRAVSPEIMRLEGQGDRSRTISFIFQTTKCSLFIALLIILPLAAERVFVLNLWLKEVPAYTSTFCLFFLCIFAIEKLTGTFVVAIQAVGNIRWYQVTMGIGVMTTIPLAWITAKITQTPVAVMVVSLFIIIVQTVCRIIWAWRLVDISPLLWFKDIVLRTLAWLSASMIVIYVIQLKLAPSLIRFVLTTSTSTIVTCFGFWFIGLNCTERNYIWFKSREFLIRIFETTLFHIKV